MPPDLVTDDHWNEEILATADTVCVVFLARGSTPCDAFASVVDGLARVVPPTVRFLRMSVEDNPATAQRYDVSSLPTMLVFRGGVLRRRLVGARPSEKLRQELSPFLF